MPPPSLFRLVKSPVQMGQVIQFGTVLVGNNNSACGLEGEVTFE